MKKLIVFLVLCVFYLTQFAQTKWNVDNVHSSVKFTVTHLVISEVEGNFKVFSGTIVSKSTDFTDAAVDFSVDVKSISIDNEMRDNHLKSPDFFNAEKFPQVTFKSTSFKKGSGNKYDLVGDLTMHGITKQVKFDVTYGGSVKDPYGNVKVGFKATAIINRFDYDLKWNAVTEAGGAVVSQEVAISLRLEFSEVK
jgi:polyisoprenoid-binding protein YceI